MGEHHQAAREILERKFGDCYSEESLNEDLACGRAVQHPAEPLREFPIL